MRLDKAYSEDLQRDITAERADRLFQEGTITSKFRFSCPGKCCSGQRCNAPVTCANLDRPKIKRKREPYYKVVGKHDPDCDLGKDIESIRTKSRITSDIYSSEDEYIPNVFRLNLRPPSTKRPENFEGSSIDDEATGPRRSNNTEDSNKRRIQPTKTLPALVDAFIARQSLNIQMPDVGVMKIDQLFVQIQGQNLSFSEDEWHIYFGEAWFNEKDSGYSVRFANKLTIDGITKCPSTYLSREDIEDSGFRRFRSNILDELCDSTPKMVFVLSETCPYVRKGYINIWCEGPEYLDYRPAP